MIQFNKTIFQITKRLALVIAGMFITSTAWCSSWVTTTDTKPTGTITVATDLGKVYASQTQGEPTWGDSHAKTKTVTIYSKKYTANNEGLPDFVPSWAINLALSVLQWDTPITEQKVYLYTQDLSTQGYVFGGWEHEGTLVTEENSNEIYLSTELVVTANLSNGDYSATYKAVWLTPEVREVVTTPLDFKKFNSTELIKDVDNNINPEAILDQTAEFKIKQYINVTNFKPSTSTNLGSLVDEKYQLASTKGFQPAGGEITTPPDANGNGVYSLPVKYIPTGIHGSITGRAILKSKVYSGEPTGEPDLSKYEWRYVNLTVQEDYRPDFTAKNNSTSQPYDLKEVALGGRVTSDAGIYPTLNNPAAKAPLGATKGTTQWTYTITELTDANGKNYSSAEIEDMFDITHTVGGQPLVIFEPKIDPNRFGFPEDGNAHTLELFATMTIQCTYLDAVPKYVQSIEGEHTTYIKITVKKENEAVLRFNDTKIDYASEDEEERGTGGTYDFGTITIGDNSKTIDLSIYAANINFASNACDITGSEKSLFLANVLNGKVTIAIPDTETCCGSKAAKLTITGTSTLDNTTKKEAVVHLTATLELAKPQVQGFGTNKTVTFTWEEVPGAESYEVYTSTNGSSWTPAKDYEYNPDKPNLSYSKNTGSNEVTIWCKVVATQSCSTTCRAESNPVPATSAMDKIDKENKAATGIYTGKQGAVPGNGRGTGSTYRQVDVSDAFDGDNPICDRLYIFGETTTNGTPLYVFVKDETNKCYRLVYAPGQSATVSDVNTTRSSYLTINLNNDGAMVKIKDTENYYDVPLKDVETPSIYFTGYCPYASTKGSGTHGVIHVIGGSKTVDLYLEDLQIYAKNNDNSVTLNIEDLKTIQTNGYYYDAPGSGAVFALESTTTNADLPFTVKMHVQNGIPLKPDEKPREVVLDAAKGATIVINMKQKVTGVGTQTVVDDKPSHYSSPIQVLVRGGSAGVNKSTKLVIDDIWGGVHTNATLNLQENTTDDENASNISIDLGNNKTKLEIDGSHIKMQGIAAAYPLATYPATDNTKWVARGLTTTNYTNTISIGKSALISDGTFTGSATGENSELQWYFPTLTIDGGSYNTPIRLYTTDNASTSDSTQIKNTDGKMLGHTTINCSNGDYGTVDKNSLLLAVTNFDKMVDDAFPDRGFNDNKAGTNYHRPLSAYYPYTINNKQYHYNCDNLFVNNWNEKKICLMLPAIDCEGKTTPWQVCGPELVMNYDGKNTNLGGSIKKVAGCVEHPQKSYNVERLLYAEIDEYTRGALGGGFFNLQQSNASISLDKNKPLYSTIDNTSAYNIQKKVYMLKPIVAAQWMLFAAPFDVQNVYVIEAYPEKQLVKDFNGVRGYIKGEENIANARKAQSKRLIELYSLWYSQVISAGIPLEFYFTPRTITTKDENNVEVTKTTYGAVIDTWMNIESAVGKDGVMNTTDEEKEKYKPIIEKLQHYIEATDAEGNVTNNLNDANYYLYESAGEWAYEASGNFTTSWKIASNSEGLVMEQGHVYAIQFPYNLIGGTHNPATDWDYWTGKYILLESTDLSESAEVHTINGTSDVEYGTASNGSAILSGNASFGESAPEPLKGNMWTVKKEQNSIQHKTELVSGSLAPTEGFLLANFTPPANMRALSIDYRTGEVTYEKIDDNNSGDIETGLPTIMGDITLIVEPTSEGLTITPIKEQHVMLFDANGKMIFSKHLSAEENVTLPTGVYVVRGEYEQVKAIKK